MTRARSDARLRPADAWAAAALVGDADGRVDPDTVDVPPDAAGLATRIAERDGITRTQADALLCAAAAHAADGTMTVGAATTRFNPLRPRADATVHRRVARALADAGLAALPDGDHVGAPVVASPVAVDAAAVVALRRIWDAPRPICPNGCCHDGDGASLTCTQARDVIDGLDAAGLCTNCAHPPGCHADPARTVHLGCPDARDDWDATAEHDHECDMSTAGHWDALDGLPDAT